MIPDNFWHIEKPEVVDLLLLLFLLVLLVIAFLGTYLLEHFFLSFIGIVQIVHFTKTIIFSVLIRTLFFVVLNVSL